MHRCYGWRGHQHTTDTKETLTEGEAVTVCLTVTGFGVVGVCTEGVKTWKKEEVKVMKDTGGEEVDSPREVLDGSCGPTIEDVEGDGLTRGVTERDEVCGEAGLLTTRDVLVATSIELLLVDCWLWEAPMVPMGALLSGI